MKLTCGNPNNFCELLHGCDLHQGLCHSCGPCTGATTGTQVPGGLSAQSAQSAQLCPVMTLEITMDEGTEFLPGPGRSEDEQCQGLNSSKQLYLHGPRRGNILISCNTF